jgi:hypothetical protein
MNKGYDTTPVYDGGRRATLRPIIPPRETPGGKRWRPQPQVQAWMRHAHIQTSARYLHHRAQHNDAALLADAFRPATADAGALAAGDGH